MQDFIVYKSEFYVIEHELAYYITRLVKTKPQAIVWDTQTLLYKQPDAVVNACTKSLSILTGPPGTGKTTTLKKIVDSFVKAGLTGAIICPTGKAAKRADEVVNTGRSFVDRIKCSTIHSFLQFDPQTYGFSLNRTNKISLDYLIIDEFSMLGCELARDVFEAVDPKKTRVVLCGDAQQLPSISPGNIARDFVNAAIIPTTQLDTVLRTGPNSGITYNANMILQGKELCKTDPHSGQDFTDFFVVQKQKDTETLATILKWVVNDIPKKRNYNPIKDIQVLSPGKNGCIGTKNLNEVLRKELNPSSSNGHGKRLSGFCIGDKVINNTNNKQLYIVNGDVGFVKDVVIGNTGRHAIIDFGPNTGPNLDGIAEMKSEYLDASIKLAYALTTHKSQGSEFPVVILPVHKTHTRLLTSNLVFTGLTRARELGMFVGEPEVLRRAIKNTVTNQRRTGLMKLLQSEYQKKSV